MRIEPALVSLKEPLTKFGDYDIPLNLRVKEAGEGSVERTPVVKVSLKQGKRIV